MSRLPKLDPNKYKKSLIDALDGTLRNHPEDPELACTLAAIASGAPVAAALLIASPRLGNPEWIQEKLELLKDFYGYEGYLPLEDKQ